MIPNNFGDYHVTIRTLSHTVIGVGHTPSEARRNAFDALECKNPDLAGFCAVMRTCHISTERSRSARVS